MMFSHLLQLKPLLMVLTAAVGAVAGGTMINDYYNGGRNNASFLLTVSPSFLTVGQGGTTNATITVTSVNGYSGTVTLSLFFPGQRLTVSLNPVNVRVHSHGNANSTLTVNAPSVTGAYSVIVIGVARVNGRTTYASTMLTIQAVSNVDFSITASPNSLIGLVGSTNMSTITVTSLNSFTGNVSLTVTAPFGYITVTGGQTPLTLTSGGTASSTLIVATVAGKTTPGTYSIVVTGTSGTHTHSTTITVTVADPIFVESLVRSGFEFVNGTTLMLNLQNTGNTTITLQSYSVRDSMGNAWTLPAWAGPTMAPSTGGTAYILIGTSCPHCIYTGIAGLFFQYNIGQAYTVTVITARNNQFTFTVTR